MKRLVLPLTAAALTLALASCSSVQTVSAKVSGTCSSGGVGGECRVQAVMTVESGGPPGAQRILGMLAAAAGATPLDAGAYELDVTGSTIPYPSKGTMMVTLQRSADASTVSAKQFSWVRVGNVIRATDPDAINEWAYANAADADSVGYAIDPFRSNYAPGLQTIAAASKYEGATETSFSETFLAGAGCTPSHTNQPCHQ